MKLVTSRAAQVTGTGQGGQASDRDALIAQLIAPARRSVRSSKWVALLALAGVVGVLGFAPIASGTIAMGQLVVDGDRKVVQHGEGGLVSEILVEEGQRVEAGDVLLRLDSIQAGAAAGVIGAQVDALRAEEAVRTAEMAGADSVTFPADLLARRADTETALVLAAQEKAFEARQALAESERQRLGEELQQIEQSMISRTAERRSAIEQAALLLEELEGLQTLLEKGLTQKPRVLALERQLSEARGQDVSLNAEISRLTAQAAETRTRRGQIEADRRAQAAEALRTIRSELSETLGRQVAASDTLRRTELLAPTSGVVMDVSVNTIGGVVGAGEELMAIVPQNDDLIIRARVRPRDADNVRSGMDAIVRFDAGGARSAPRVKGVVRTISADALVDDRTGESYFDVRIAVSGEAVAETPSELIAPGLPAEVLIATGQSTAFRYIVRPIEDAMFKAMRDS